jgi:hypothetical protein
MGARPEAVEGSSIEPPPGLGDPTLLLDADELRMLEIFHRSFNLPGLRLGLVKPVCSEDYLPQEDEQFLGLPGEPTAADMLSGLLQQTSALRLEADDVLTVDDEVIEDEEVAEEPLTVTAPPSIAGVHQRSVRPGSRPPSRPTSSAPGSRPVSRPTSSGYNSRR